MLSLQLEIFLLLALGWFLASRRILARNTRDQITSLVLNLVLPASIIRSFELDLTWEQFTTLSAVLFCSIDIQILYSIAAKLLWRKEPENHRINLCYGTLVSNAGFMGMPICEQLYGSIGLLCSSIFLIPSALSCGVRDCHSIPPQTGVLPFGKFCFTLYHRPGTGCCDSGSENERHWSPGLSGPHDRSSCQLQHSSVHDDDRRHDG